MQKFKNILFNCTIILPIISKIANTVSFLIEFHTTNKEVVAAREELKKLIEEAKQVGYDFNKTMED